MDVLGFNTQCKVRQCSRCKDGTEFYCNTCKHDLCLQCKERHVIDLDTIYHDVVIYREKYDYIPIQEICVKHSDKIYKKYCKTCDIPVCFQCKEHRKHKTFDIKRAYKTHRKQYKEIVHSIRGDTLYNSCFLLAEIKADLKTFQKKIINFYSNVSTKAQKLKDLIDIKIVTDKIKLRGYIMDRFQKQSRKIKRHIADIQNFEYRSEQSSNRSVKFLSILKNSRIHKIKDTPKLKRHIMLSLKEEIFMKDVIRLLSEIQTKESGKRQARNECMLKLMPVPKLLKWIETEVSEVTHISCLSSDRVWISDVMEIKMFLTNIAGEKLRHITDMVYTFGTVGYHAVTSTCDLIYVDADGNIIKLSKNYRKNTLIKNTESRKPSCLYISRLTGDLLVGIWDIRKAGIVNRYNSKGKHIQTIQNKLYYQPVYITENRNGDIIVSDWDRKAVVVTERGGKHRFSYTGRSSSSLPSGIMPCGICTDVFSQILVCDANTRTIHVLDKDGNQLSQIWTKQQVKYFPHSLSYDEKTHRLWIGFSNNRVCLFRYINRQDISIRNCDPH